MYNLFYLFFSIYAIIKIYAKYILLINMKLLIMIIFDYFQSFLIILLSIVQNPFFSLSLFAFSFVSHTNESIYLYPFE